MPADFPSHTYIDDIAAIPNVKAIAAAIDPFTPTLVEEQAADPNIVKFKQFFCKKTWPLGTSEPDQTHLLPLLSKLFTRNGRIWIRLDGFERQHVAMYLPIQF